MNVGFTGTQKGMTIEQSISVARVLDRLMPDIGHHGDCLGADAGFHEICMARGIEVVIHPPEDAKKRAWCGHNETQPGPAVRWMRQRPYLVRNREIVGKSDVLIAAPHEQIEPPPAQGQGTWSTVRFARKVKVLVAIVWPDGKVTYQAPLPETCGCENSACEVCHSNGCKSTATVPCMYVGAICEPCAQWMPDEYLLLGVVDDGIT